MTTRLAAALLLSIVFCGSSYGQAPPRVQVGVCVDADKFEAARAAGFDYVEIGASKVARDTWRMVELSCCA